MSSNFLQALAGIRLYPVTDRHLSGLSSAEQVVLLSEGGATLIQLREKTEPPAKFYAEAKMALDIARERGVKIIINDRVDIALALRADGVHLGQEDLPPDAARRILGPDALIGFSTHNLEQAKRAAHLPVDYVAIGPIFPTATKKSENPPVGLEGLRLLRQSLGSIPIVAIGGITAQNIGLVLETGADAAAVISDIWTPPSDIPSKIKHLIKAS
jgi:thiamine-phosphate pyrophosphorylase